MEGDGDDDEKLQEGI